MKHMKRYIALVLCVLMFCSATLQAFAEEEISAEESSAAEAVTKAYVEATAETEEPQIGDDIWIKRGSVVYKKAYDTKGHTLILNYQVTIEAIVCDENGEATWYKFSPAVNWWFEKYEYVKVENTSVEEPGDTEPGDDPEMEAAKELYSAWGNYTSEEKRAKLEYLQSEDGSAEYDAFNALRFPEVEGDVRTSIAYFVDGIDVMASVEEVESFESASADILKHYENTGLDIAVPQEKVEAYEQAYGAISQSVGSDAEVDYPADELKGEVSAAFATVVGHYYDALDSYTEGDLEIALADNTAYTGAFAKMNALQESAPDLFYGDIVLLALNNSLNNITTIDTKENDGVEIHVFNYGAAINNQNVTNRGFIAFNQSTTYDSGNGNANDEVIDGTISMTSSFPEMSKTLVDGYPYVSENDKATGGTNKAGSLKYLFDKNSTFVQGTGTLTDYANLGSVYDGSTSYQSMHYSAKTGDSGLFKDIDGYYYYDSTENAAWFDPSTQQFQVYNTTVVPKYNVGSTSSSHIGNFLPFNKITADTVDIAEWSNKTEGAVYAEVNLKHTSNKNRSDMWFGMTAEFDFYMPEGGKKNDQPMIFEFTGDDDVWVYIDDVLILDIGGTHGAYNGSINFATGAVSFQNTKDDANKKGVSTNLKELYQDAYDNLSDKNSDIAKKIKNIIDNGFTGGGIFKDFTKHSFNFFYLERGGNISTCKLKFNMDPLPIGNVSVEKKVAGVNANLLDNQSYSFTVSATHATPSEVELIPYMIYDTTTSPQKAISSNDVENGGVISLKANQKALFDLPQGTIVTFKEVIDSGVTNGYSWMLNDTAVETVSVTVGDGTQDAAAFTCTNTRITEELVIEKQFEGTHYNHNEEFVMTLWFKPTEDATPVLYTGMATKTTTERVSKEIQITNGTVPLKVGESIKISGIPTGTYYVLSETEPSNGYYDQPMFKSQNEQSAVEKVFGTQFTGTVDKDEENNVVVTNRHGVGNLTITKNLTEAAPEDQTFLFELSGNGRTMTVALTVAKGEKTASLKIVSLPYGEYTVEELLNETTNWSWRYTLSEGETKTKTAILKRNSSEGSVAFSNAYSEQKWLSGDCYVENWWNNDTIQKRDGSNQEIK